MLTVRRLTLRTACRSCPTARFSQRRNAHSKRPKPAAYGPPRYREPPANHVETEAVTTPSLIEQLFPEESKRYEAQQKASRQVPRLPLDPPPAPRHHVQPPRDGPGKDDDMSPRKRRFLAGVLASGPGTAVLALLNASNNLVEEDFRRLVPQGKHIEGWALAQGDILKVIPGRNMQTLAHQNVYYLLFSSAHSAFEYQGHAIRVHKLAALHAPTSTMSALPPPPGYKIEGLDVHSAIESYTLKPPSQPLELRLLSQPLSPHVQSLIRHNGFATIVGLIDKMTHPVRFTMDGPQLQRNTIYNIMLKTAEARALAWSGGENMAPDMIRWQPGSLPSSLENKDSGGNINLQKESDQGNGDNLDVSVGVSAENGMAEHDPDALKHRTASPVYVLGFHTENAAQSFIRHWHQRPLEFPGGQVVEESEGDAATIANVELLW